MFVQRFIQAIFLTGLIAGVGTGHAQTLSVTTSQAAPGSIAQVSVYVDSQVTNLAGIQFKLDFGTRQPGSAPLLAPDPHGQIHSPMFGQSTNAIHKTATTVSFAAAGVAGKNGPGVVLTVPFLVPVNALANTRYHLRLLNVVGTRPNRQTIPLTTQAGYLITTQAGVAGIVVSNGSGTAGGTAMVAVSASSHIKNVAGAQFKLRFDPALAVQTGDVTSGGLITGPVQANNDQPGTLGIAVAEATGNNGPGDIVRVKFQIPQDAPAGKEYRIDITDVLLVDSRNRPIGTMAVGGKIVVTAKDGEFPILDGGLISVKSQRVSRNQNVEVAVLVNDKIRNLNGVQFRLVFSTKTPSNAPNLYPAPFGRQAIPGNVLHGATFQVNPKNPGEIAVAMASARAGNGPGTLIILPLRVPENAPPEAVYNLELHDVVLSINGHDYSVAAEGGTLTVMGRKPGDVANREGRDEGDDHINAIDAIALLRILIGLMPATPGQIQAADANCDENVTITDVVKILKFAVGLEQLCSGDDGTFTTQPPPR